jgi:hypothetical protein
MAVSLSLLAGAGWQFFDDNGNPLSGGLLYTYEAGTTTPVTTYTSSSGATANANPVVLDAAGRVPEQIWLNTAYVYKFVLQTSVGVAVWTKDNIPGANSAIPPVVVANLPSAALIDAGSRAFVSDATVTTFASVVVGGGSNTVPVYSDGVNWRIG